MSGPIWASEPFRIFFPLGIIACLFGLALWPLHYFGWWPLYPALQHPRILIFGFGVAFVIGFLGTAWPRFLESRAINRSEVLLLAGFWTVSQLAYVQGSIGLGDILISATLFLLLVLLSLRFRRNQSPVLPPGFTLAFLSVCLGLGVVIAWSLGWHLKSPQSDLLLRLLGYQAFLILPLLGVGSYLFPRILGEKGVDSKRRAFTVWISALVLVVSIFVEVYVSARAGNLLRLAAIVGWSAGVLPMIFRFRLSGTRPWAIQTGLLLLGAGFLFRAIWTHEIFAFEHFLFLGGFSQLILLVAERVIDGHCGEEGVVKPVSPRWRWFVWLIVLTAATRATADLVPSTRNSHHIYAAVMLIGILVFWFVRLLPRLRRVRS